MKVVAVKIQSTAVKLPYVPSTRATSVVSTAPCTMLPSVRYIGANWDRMRSESTSGPDSARCVCRRSTWVDDSAGELDLPAVSVVVISRLQKVCRVEEEHKPYLATGCEPG